MDFINDADFITEYSLRKLKIVYNKELIIESLSKHHDYPSLVSVKNIIEEHGVLTEPVKIDINMLSGETFPLISYLLKPKAIVLIEKYDKKKGVVEYTSAHEKSIKENLDDFSQRWSGIVIRLIKQKSTKRRNIFKSFFNNKNRLILIFLFVIPTVLSLFSLAFKKENNGSMFLFIPKVFGLFLSWHLVIKENFADNNWLSNICKFNKIFDCQKVIDSGYGRLFNFVDLSELVAVYFTFTSTLLVLGIISNNCQGVYPILFLINLMGLPVILYSLFVQTFKLKSYCPLCLITIFIYILEIFVFFIRKTSPDLDRIMFLSYELLISTGILGLILYLKNLLMRIWKGQLKKGEQVRNWFVNLPGFMDFYFEKKESSNMGSFGENFVGIYNPEAKTKVTLIVNSECIHCKNILTEIDEFISRNDCLISIELRFNNVSEINSYIIAGFLSKQNNKESWLAFRFYLTHGLKEFGRKFYFDENILRKSGNVNAVHHQWCKDNDFLSAPIVFIDDKQVPSILTHASSIVKYLDNKLNFTN